VVASFQIESIELKNRKTMDGISGLLLIIPWSDPEVDGYL
jgi:hypothetical protein